MVVHVLIAGALLLVTAQASVAETRVEYLMINGDRGAVASRAEVPAGAWVNRVLEMGDEWNRLGADETFLWDIPEKPCDIFTTYDRDFFIALLLIPHGQFIPLGRKRIEPEEPGLREACMMREIPEIGRRCELACRNGSVRSSVEFAIEFSSAQLDAFEACGASSGELRAVEGLQAALAEDPTAARMRWRELLELERLPLGLRGSGLPTFGTGSSTSTGE